MTDAILLDTHVAIWLSLGTLPDPALESLTRAGDRSGLLVSPVVAWEAGLLASRSASATNAPPGDVRVWYRRLLANPVISECVFDGEIAIASTMLPGDFHRDPADRFLVATARSLGCTLMTRDEKILVYAAQGHVKAVPC